MKEERQKGWEKKKRLHVDSSAQASDSLQPVPCLAKKWLDYHTAKFICLTKTWRLSTLFKSHWSKGISKDKT